MKLILPSLLFTTQVLSLWPIPLSLHTGSSFLKLDPSFDIRINRAPYDLRAAITRTKAHLENDKLERLVVGRGAVDRNDLSNAPSLLTLELSLTAESSSIMEEATKPIGSRIEGYSLSIPSTGGTSRITANSTLGLFRGLTTFEQLFYFDGECTIYTYQAPIDISDTPAYVSDIYISLKSINPNFKQPYRGFMLDTSRNL